MQITVGTVVPVLVSLQASRPPHEAFRTLVKAGLKYPRGSLYVQDGSIEYYCTVFGSIILVTVPNTATLPAVHTIVGSQFCTVQEVVGSKKKQESIISNNF